jgi:putative PIN family toxin of toxin-antitoxin system
MRVVLDTNVLVAAFIARGACNELLEHCAIHHEIVLSPFILTELRRVLTEKIGFTQRETSAVVRLLRSRCRVVKPQPFEKTVSRDPDDDNIIATAVAGSCTCLVTGDQDLLELGEFAGIRIVSPDSFWRLENELTDPPADGEG